MSSRIVHVMPGLARGGAESILFRMLGALPAEERAHHQVVSLLDNVEFDFGSIGVLVAVFDLKGGPLKALRAFWRMRQHVRALNPDVVQGWLYIGAIAAFLAAPRSARLVFSLHDGLADWSMRSLGERGLIRLTAWMSRVPWVRVVHYCSGFGWQNHLRAGFPAARSLVVRNGYDAQRFRFSEEGRRRLRAEWGLGEGVTAVACCARFHPVKDHGTLFRACARLRDEGRELVVLLAGLGTEPEGAGLKELLGTCGLPPGAVRCLGVRDDLADLYSAADVCVLTSRSEAFPNVLAEAGLCGIPCVSTEVGDVEVILGNRDHLVPVGDVEALVGHLRRMMQLSLQERQAMGSRLRSHLERSVGMPAFLDTFRREVWL